MHNEPRAVQMMQLSDDYAKKKQQPTLQTAGNIVAKHHSQLLLLRK